MSTASLSSAALAIPEFIIYAFEKDEVSKGSPVWQTHKILDDEDEACREADQLFTDQKFTRIEVRRRGDDEVIKVCDHRPPAMRRFYFMLFGAGACIITAALITIYQ